MSDPIDYAALARLLHSPDLLMNQQMQAGLPMQGGGAPAYGSREYILSVPNPGQWVRSRIGQITRDRRGVQYKGNPDRVGGTPKDDQGKYPPNAELLRLRAMLKEFGW